MLNYRPVLKYGVIVAARWVDMIKLNSVIGILLIALVFTGINAVSTCSAEEIIKNEVYNTPNNNQFIQNVLINLQVDFL